MDLKTDIMAKMTEEERKKIYDYCINNVYKVRTISYDNRREDIELFSREAFREAWYNACLHNSGSIILYTTPAS